MASVSEIYVIRDKAKRYSALTADYASWARNVKTHVRNAGEEDWGTYIAAFALLESIIPDDVRFTIEQQVEFEKRQQNLLEDIAKRRRVAQRTCMLLGASFALLASVLFIASDYLLFGRILETNSAFSVYGLAFFAVFGGASAGFAIGARAEKPGQPSHGLKALWACLAGIACAFACPLLPPISLVLAWLAWHVHESSKDAVNVATNHEQEHAQIRKQRVFSQDPHAPMFVKRALRLAGIYQASPDPIRQIAHAALSEPQSDYGSFVAYEAILSDWHARHSSEAAVSKEDSSSASDLNQDESNQNVNNHSSSVIRNGVIAGFLTFLLLCAMANPNLVQIITSVGSSNSILPIAMFAVCIPGAIIGWRSAKRVNTMEGLPAAEKRTASILRSAWFAAWLALFCILILHAILLGIF